MIDFENEIYQATACYVIWKNLQNEPAKDEGLLKALNHTPLSWTIIRHSMMLSLIMALGRIFDINGKTVSIDDVIKSCISDIELFSKESLKKALRILFGPTIKRNVFADKEILSLSVRP